MSTLLRFTKKMTHKRSQKYAVSQLTSCCASLRRTPPFRRLLICIPIISHTVKPRLNFVAGRSDGAYLPRVALHSDSPLPPTSFASLRRREELSGFSSSETPSKIAHLLTPQHPLHEI